jgi:hypothetical protein
MGKGESKMASSGSGAAKSGAKTGGKAVRKIREFATNELFDVGTDMVAFMASHFVIDFVRGVPNIFKNAFGKLGKAAGEKFEAGDLSKVINEVKAGLTSEKMPATYRLELERIIESQLQSASIILADGEMSTSERIVALNNIKRNMQDEMAVLEQRYREEPFQIRIIPRLSEAHQEKLEQMAMTDLQEIEWQKLRDQIKSVEMFSRTLEHATDAKDLLKRLQRNLGTPKKPDPQEALSAKINETGRMLKQGLMAVDTFIKDLLPYEEIRLPNMKRKELWADYWNRVISAPDVQSLKQSGEGDSALKKRLMADKKFVAVMERKLQERNRRI